MPGTHAEILGIHTFATGFPQAGLRTIAVLAKAQTIEVGAPPMSPLGEIDQPVLQLFAMVSEGLAAATAAFRDNDRDAARAVVAAEQEIDSLELRIEELIQRELANGPNLVSGTRHLVAVLRIVPELERSGDVARRVRDLCVIEPEMTP